MRCSDGGSARRGVSKIVLWGVFLLLSCKGFVLVWFFFPYYFSSSVLLFCLDAAFAKSLKITDITRGFVVLKSLKFLSLASFTALKAVKVPFPVFFCKLG